MSGCALERSVGGPPQTVAIEKHTGGRRLAAGVGESALLVEVEREADNRDADYQPPLELEEDEKSSEESDDVECARTSTQQLKRKLSGTPTATGTPAVGVIEEQAGVEVGSAKKRSRTSVWRDRKGKTRKARAMNMQPSVASLFKTLPCNKHTTINVDVMALREESEESSGGETEDTTASEHNVWALASPTLVMNTCNASCQIKPSTASAVAGPAVTVLDFKA
ncbi:hypothetical protein PC9H_002001 [Pleurotus ostreatus]|uniref:Uncharacterized protein n=1 Tax=Pleurotus ostreatus TaxID=5322 RepID=A0A8H6ZLQ9_PLEOS|nr:uncharacterized protein PC9H_002001 [Pleurotus ostreatus]KAF7419411.1 hypothetical protein PC9H_002001 [Pleurotus ostreatus]